MVLHKVCMMRQIYKAAKSRIEQQPNLIHSFSRLISVSKMRTSHPYHSHC
jgi:hypothetical protein